MNPILRNVLAVIAGGIVGGVVNMGIVTISPSIIPPPDGTDITTMEGLQEAMLYFEPKHFIMPFLAHAVGTLVGAYTAARIAVTHKMKLALLIGAFFLVGGIMAVMSLSSLMWYSIVDLVGAYIPMGWIGGRLATRS